MESNATVVECNNPIQSMFYICNIIIQILDNSGRSQIMLQRTDTNGEYKYIKNSETISIAHGLESNGGNALGIWVFSTRDKTRRTGHVDMIQVQNCNNTLYLKRAENTILCEVTDDIITLSLQNETNAAAEALLSLRTNLRF